MAANDNRNDEISPHRPYWALAPRESRYPAMKGDETADVAIVGGGISGLTAGLLLAREGKRVILIEQGKIGSGETGRTTAHLTEAIDSGYSQVESDFTREGAHLVATGSRSSIEMIGTFCREHEFECQFESLPGYLYTEYSEDVEKLEKEYEAARRAGLQVQLVDKAPLPFPTRKALRFENQAQFNPMKYLDGLAAAFRREGGVIYEMTPMLELHEDEPVRLRTPHGILRAVQVFVAAHVPSNNRFTLFTKIASYRSYAMAVRTPHAERLHGLFWDTMQPYHYIRRVAGADSSFLIVGGEDHKTGMRHHTEKAYLHLEGYARDRLDTTGVLHSWSGQIVEPVDGLPYIGRNPFSENVYIATGFAGQGMTFGTLSGRIVSDLILERASGWSELFSPSRFKPRASARDFLSENKDVPLHLMKDRLASFRSPDVSTLKRGEGKVVKVGSTLLAVYRDEKDHLRGFSPECPHMGCHVGWNNAERTWDCPCHGSRFDNDGQVINGPANCGLKKVDVEETLAFEHGRQGNNVPMPERDPQKRVS